MQLLVNGVSLPVAQLGPDFVLLEKPINHPPVVATMILKVDQSVRSWPVHLLNGISADSKRVTLGVAQ